MAAKRTVSVAAAVAANVPMAVHTEEYTSLSVAAVVRAANVEAAKPCSASVLYYDWCSVKS
jgi:hypothetical protein